MWRPIVTAARGRPRGSAEVIPSSQRSAAARSGGIDAVRVLVAQVPGPQRRVPGERRPPPQPPAATWAAHDRRGPRTSCAARSDTGARRRRRGTVASRSAPPSAHGGIQSTPLMCPANSVGMIAKPARSAASATAPGARASRRPRDRASGWNASQNRKHRTESKPPPAMPREVRRRPPPRSNRTTTASRSAPASS